MTDLKPIKLKIGLTAFLFFILTPYSAQAMTAGKFSVGAGIISQNVFNTTNSVDGSLSFFGPIHLPLNFQYSMTGFLGQEIFAPRLMYTFIPQVSDDGAADQTLMLISFPFVNKLGAGSWDWKWGLGILRTTLQGKGGTKTLNNGTGTATFALPNRSSSSQVFTLEVGLGTQLFPKWRMDLDLVSTGFLTNRRAFNYFVTFNYEFGGQ